MSLKKCIETMEKMSDGCYDPDQSYMYYDEVEEVLSILRAMDLGRDPRMVRVIDGEVQKWRER